MLLPQFGCEDLEGSWDITLQMDEKLLPCIANLHSFIHQKIVTHPNNCTVSAVQTLGIYRFTQNSTGYYR
jgi:hypothetical protein